MIRWLLIVPMVATMGLGQPDTTIVLRAHEPAPSGQVQSVSVDGVVVGSSVSAPVIVGWNRVKTITGEYADDSKGYLQTADQAWRAMSRLDRGDAAAAEPIFERLFETYRGRRGPTAAAISEGLLRCRLRRNAQTLAVDAWLAWLYAKELGDGPQWYQSRGQFEDVFVVDEETGLLPDLPPIWLDLPAVRVFASRPQQATDQMGTREGDLAALYQHAAALASGMGGPMPKVTSHDTGVRLVWDIVQAQSFDADERALGRKAIRARLKKKPGGWRAAWLDAALGRSLLLEKNPEQQQRGVIELLRVRVLRSQDSPYLAGLALAQAAVALRSMGQTNAADLLRQELLDRFPGHPATVWDEIDVWNEKQARANTR